MDLNQLRGAVALADHGTFTRAAAALHMTQPSLSYTIGRLESELGTRLFERLPTGVIETSAGARCRFAYDVGEGWEPSGQVLAATPWRWVGALLGLFAVAPTGGGHAGAATFTQVRIVRS